MRLRSILGFTLAISWLALSAFASREKFNLVTSISYPAGNLISNGSFENNYTADQFEAWSQSLATPIDPGAFKPLLAEDDVHPYNGRGMAAARFTVPKIPARFLVSAPFPLKPDTWYTFFLRYRTKDYSPTNSANYIQPVFQTFRSRDVLPESAPLEEQVLPSDFRNGPAYVTAADWTEYTHRFKTGSDANFGVISLLWGNNGGTFASDGTIITAPASGSFYFDDAYLTEGCVKSGTGGSLPEGCPVADVALARENDSRHPDFIGVARKFLDGNNREVQHSTQDGTRDIVVQTIYDENGRVLKAALPIGNDMVENRHDYVPGITADNGIGDYLSKYYLAPATSPANDVVLPGQSTAVRYPDAGGAAYSENRYDDSPLGRVVETAGAGTNWKIGSQGSIKTKYSSVPNLTDLAELPSPFLVAGEYYVKESVGGNGQVTREYTDRSGKVIKRSGKITVGGAIQWANVDYKFDAAGNISEVRSPGAGTRLSSFSTYDASSLLISEITPESGLTNYIYDSAKRLRFKQTANDAIAVRFTFFQYDGLGRVSAIGDVTDASGFTQAKADMPEYPCIHDCANAAIALSQDKVKYRTLNQYDTENGAGISCLTGPAPANGGSPGIRLGRLAE